MPRPASGASQNPGQASELEDSAEQVGRMRGRGSAPALQLEGHHGMSRKAQRRKNGEADAEGAVSQSHELTIPGSAGEANHPFHFLISAD